MDQRSTPHAEGTSRSRIYVASHAVTGIANAEFPMLVAFAGGTGGGPVNETAGSTVQFFGTRDTDFIGSLIEAWEAGTSGSSANHDWIEDSVVSPRASSAQIWTTSTTCRAGRWNWWGKLVIPEELKDK